MSRQYPEGLAYWCNKVERAGQQSFAPSAGKWAACLLRELDRRADGTASARDFRALADELGIPVKFLSRALALTGGLVSLELGPPRRVELHRDRVLHSRVATGAHRRHISDAHRRRLFVADFHICGRCGYTFDASHLEVDHLIPLAVRGADEPGNWVALCRSHNAGKRSHLRYGFIHYYRGERVRGSVGVRFQDGFFWPVVNGWLRHETRTEWATPSAPPSQPSTL